MKNLLKITFIVFTVISLTSCVSLTQVPLKGDYLDKPYVIEIDKSFDETWSSIIDLFATKGLSIKIIEKSSGLIVSEKTSFYNDYTFENENGDLENPKAFLVLDTKKYEGFGRVEPDNVTAEWNIRIKEVDSNRTSVNINLTNIDAKKITSGSQYTAGETFIFTGKSTGEFEKIIISFLE